MTESWKSPKETWLMYRLLEKVRKSPTRRHIMSVSFEEVDSDVESVSMITRRDLEEVQLWSGEDLRKIMQICRSMGDVSS